MTTVNRTIESDIDRDTALKLIENRRLPFTLTLTDGKHRTTAQNKLQHMWMTEIAQQKGDMTPAEVRAYCKLTIGVPLLRAENEAFREGYDKTVRPLSYAQKIALMGEPLDLPVTRLMTTKQKTQYLDAIARHFGEQGIVLTIPDDMRESLNTNPGDQSPPDQPADDATAQTAALSQPDDRTVSPDLGSEEPAVISPTPGAAAGSSSDHEPIPEKDLPVLRHFAKDVLNRAADPNTSGDLMSKIMRRWLNMDIANLSAPGRAAAKAIADSVKAIMENNVSLEPALMHHAEGLGCEVDDLMEERADG